MGFMDRVRDLWQADTQHYVHGWIEPPDAPATGADHSEGTSYLQIRCAAMSLRFSKERFTGRSPVFQSAIKWPTRDSSIRVSQTIDPSRFMETGAADSTGFRVFEIADKALCGELPLNSGDVELDVAVLAAPGSSMLDRATSFLSEIASLTLVPQLTAAAPVAGKIADGVDALLGNDDVIGVLAFSTSISASRPRAGYYLVTDVPTQSANDLQWFAVLNGRLVHYSDERTKWEPASGFSYLLLEFRVEGSKPNRWMELPDIVDLSESALKRLAETRTQDGIQDAWSPMHLAVLKALYSQDLAHVDRDPAAKALTEQWKREVQRLTEIAGPVSEPTAVVGPSPPPPVREPSAPEPVEPAVLAAASKAGQELDAMAYRVQVNEVDVHARNSTGATKGISAANTSWLRAGKVTVVSEDSGGPVVGIEIN